eukprot:355792-Chlamydomonas_euryale.AAC.9
MMRATTSPNSTVVSVPASDAPSLAPSPSVPESDSRSAKNCGMRSHASVCARPASASISARIGSAPSAASPHAPSGVTCGGSTFSAAPHAPASAGGMRRTSASHASCSDSHVVASMVATDASRVVWRAMA